MNLDSLSYTLSQISYLVSNLSKKNYKPSVQEIFDVIQIQGFEADRHLLRCLFSHIDLKDTEGPRNTSHKDYYQAQLLAHQCTTLLNKPSLTSILCFALDNPLFPQKAQKPSIQQFTQLSRILHLSPVQEVVFGLVCLESTNYSIYALQFVKQKLPLLIKNYINSDINSNQVVEGGLHDSSPEVLHLILSHVFNVDDQLFGISKEVKNVLLTNLRRDFPLEVAPVLLAPIIYPDKPDHPMDKINSDTSTIPKIMENPSLPNLIMEMGYSVCSSLDECRRNLLSVTNGCVPSVTFGPESVAKVISMMIRTHTGLDSQLPLPYWTEDDSDNDTDKISTNSITWNIEVFVNTIKELNPSLSWMDLIKELDHEQFFVKDRQGLVLLFLALRLGLNSPGYHIENFPINMIYRRWNHSDAQMSLIQHILQSSDVFCFADYPYRSVSIDSLKSIPDADNKDINTWRSIELVDLLLYLAERGLYYEVQECLKFPAQKCPDILALALIESNGPLNIVRHEIISSLIPIFLGNHSNSAIILHHAWNHQNVGLRHTLAQAMSDWYMRSDCDNVKLSRILDIAQDLKALSLLLSVQQFPFIIDLACLASRREYLKLDKWLTDKIQEQSEGFVSACVKFIQKRFPQLCGSLTKEENASKYTPLSSETILIILNCLRNVSGTVSQELSETIIQMVTNYTNMYMPKVPSIRVNTAPPPTAPIFRPTHHRPIGQIEGPALQVMVDHLTGLATSLASLGLNPTTQNTSTFTLPGSLGQLVQTPGSPSRSLVGNVSGLGGFSIMTPSSIPLAPGSNIPSQLSGSSNMLGRLPQQQVLPSVIGKSNHQIDNSLFMDGNMPVSVPKDIEDEANSYFQRIYNLAPHNSLSIDEVLETLKRFQESPVKREREVFCCMLRNLFEEYRFFPAYPEKELITTAHLFGGIIEHSLVSNYKALGLALRFILDALKKSPNSKMYNFGITALDRFKNRLKDYHQYCSHITAIPHFNQFPQHLIEFVEYGKNSQEPPATTRITDLVGISCNTISQGTFIPSLHNIFKAQSITTTTTTTTPMTSTSSKLITTNALLSTRPSIANTTNIDTLLVATEKDDKLVVPPENLQDKIAFIFNNLSQVNLQTKCDEIREIINNDYLPWLSQYLVMKRVSIEFNFHSLYSNFLDCLNNEKLNSLINMETFRNIRILLKSDKGMDNFSDRSLLKNLGHWLGMITLAKNKPIVLDDINLTMLLVEAYNKGHQELLFTVPFIAKVLESCAKSKVFKPRNPWTMSVMNCLAELHQEPDLKLTLKFEVEVLCKALNIDIQDLKPGYVLKNPEIAKKLKQQLSNEENSKPHIQCVLDLPKTVSTSQPHTPIYQSQQHNMNPTISSMNSIPSMSSIASMNSNAQFNDDLVGHVVSSGGGITSLSSNGCVSISGMTEMSPTLPSFEPKYNYVTFNAANSAQSMSMVVINSQIPLFVSQPALKNYVQAIIERSIQDWLNPVVDRSVKVAATTTENIVKKDFGMDPDESHMRKAAHCMVRNLTSGLTMITCREQIVQLLTSNLKQHFLSVIMTPTQTQKEMIDQACTMCANDNLELACAFVQKTATEKAVLEIDKYLKTEFDRRNVSRMEGRRYCDPMVMSGQAEYLPDSLRNKVGLPLPQMIGIYEDFAMNIPGFLPLDREAVSLFMPKPTIQLDEMTVMYEKIINEIEVLLQLYMNNQRLMTSTTQAANIHSVLEAMTSLRRSRDIVNATNIIHKIVESYLEGLCPPANQDLDMSIRFRDVHLNIIRAFQDPRAYNMQWTNKILTKAVVESREEIRFNIDAIDVLIRAGMLNIGIYDMHLAMSMDNGTNYVSIVYVKQFLQHYLIDNRSNSPINESHFQATIEALNNIVLSGRPIPDGLTVLLEMIRPSQTDNSLVNQLVGSTSTNTTHSLLQGRDYDDPPGLLEKTEFLLKEWLTIYNAAPNRDPSKTFSSYIQQMNVQGILKSDDIITRFFRLSTQMMVELCYRQLPDQTQSPSSIRAKLFHTIDAYVKLIVLLIKHSGDANAVTTKTNLLNKVLGIVVGVLLQDHDVQATDFHQLPYHRILITLFLDLNAPDPVLESINYPILAVFCHTFHLLRPRKVPGFTYAWLELISHRIFIGRLLGTNPQQKRPYEQTSSNDLQGWNFYAQLLVDLFKYLGPFLRNAELAKPVHLLYKGTLRVLLILLHDFPEFLCEYHYGFCDVIPPNCIQMRNLILSAFPRNMRLPDPFTPNLKVDVLQEISVAPKISPDFPSFIQPISFKKDLDLYLKTRSPVTFLSEIRTTLQHSCCEPGMRYDLPLLNAIVLYVGTQAIQQIRSKGLVPNTSTITHSAHMDIFQNLSVDLDTEGRYLFLNAIANQLRYPNSHTHYFSCTLLYLFAEANSEVIQEQITRVLLERLIVNRPHPWGLLITFIELIKNPAYKFWTHEFVHCAPEIEKLFESVARSCMVPKQPTSSMDDDNLPNI